MVLLKYNKNIECVYLPHLDMLRAFTRTLKRADADIKYSQGFNPHYLIYFAPPLPIGLASECEYAAIDCSENAEILLKKYNSVCLQGLRAERAFDIIRNPNIAAVAKQADIELKLAGIAKYYGKMQDFISRDEALITFTKQGKSFSEDIKPKLFSITEVDEDTVIFRLGCGQNNLRADRLVSFWAAEWGFSTEQAVYTRKQLYCTVNNTLLDIDSAVINKLI